MSDDVRPRRRLGAVMCVAVALEASSAGVGAAASLKLGLIRASNPTVMLKTSSWDYRPRSWLNSIAAGTDVALVLSRSSSLETAVASGLEVL